MKTLQTPSTYIDHRPQTAEPFTHDPLLFKVTRDDKTVLSYEVRKYTVFAGKMAVKGLKMALAGSFNCLGDMIEQAEKQRVHKAEMAKQGVSVKYSLF